MVEHHRDCPRRSAETAVVNPLLDRLVPAVATTPAERAAAWCLRRWLLVLIPVPDKTRVVHLFAGKVDLSILRGDTLDIRPELDPTFCVDAETCPGAPLEQYDLVVADPPYSAEDAAHYGTPMVNRDRVMRTLAERLAPGCYVVWLDQVLPRYRKAVLAREASIGVSRSTGHRNRCVDIFRRRDPAKPVRTNQPPAPIVKPRTQRCWICGSTSSRSRRAPTTRSPDRSRAVLVSEGPLRRCAEQASARFGGGRRRDQHQGTGDEGHGAPSGDCRTDARLTRPESPAPGRPGRRRRGPGRAQALRHRPGPGRLSRVL